MYVAPQIRIDTKDIDTLLATSNKVIIIGDLNAKHQAWNCHRANKSGKSLYKHIRKKPYAIQAPDNYTLYPYLNALPSIVDIAIIKNICNFQSIEAINELDSDHHPVLVALSSHNTKTSNRTFLNYKRANWENKTQTSRRK